ncbi:MAG: hypothetical protein H0Z34_04115 [Brevibacillus sp.]|nr:hypothetical protein [Brevibacillus sp.]
MDKKVYLSHLMDQIESLKEKKRHLTVRFATELSALDEELNQKMDEYYRHLHDVVYHERAGTKGVKREDQTHAPVHTETHQDTAAKDLQRASLMPQIAGSAYHRPYFNVETDIVPKVESFLKQVGRPATKNEIVQYLKQHHHIAYKNPFVILKKCEQLSNHVEKIGRALYRYTEKKEQQSRSDGQVKINTFKTDVLPLIIDILREKNQPVTGKEIFQELEQKHQLVYLNYTLTMNRVISLEPRVRKVDRDLYVFEEDRQ